MPWMFQQFPRNILHATLSMGSAKGFTMKSLESCDNCKKHGTGCCPIDKEPDRAETVWCWCWKKKKGK
jgi:hypothetical protein